MGRIADLIRRLPLRRRGAQESDIDLLRNTFRARYHHFKLLLIANNKALEVMAEMEEALKGIRPFGMNFVLSSCTRVSTNVWQIAKHLDELAPNKYEDLYPRFKEIQEKINPFLRQGALPSEGPFIIPIEAVNRDLADQVGSKMASLGEIHNAFGFRISPGFVITAQAYRRFMEVNDLHEEIQSRIQTTDMEEMDTLLGLSAWIQQLIIRSPLPEDLLGPIMEHYRLLEEAEGKGVRVAMRSSALGEDAAGTSFAGQYRSELNVSTENIPQVYKDIVASKYSLQAMMYRLNRGIRDETVAMCVGCLSMVDAAAGGVLYSRNPLDIRDKAIVINSVWGLPKSVVDGSAASDLFVVARDTPARILRQEIARKDHQFVCYPDEGVCRLDTTEDKVDMPSLAEPQIMELAQMAQRMEGYYGLPLDIEWALDRKGRMILLQSRPLKQMKEHPVREMHAQDRDEPGEVLVRGGTAASPGAGAGPVFVIRKEADLLRFPKGGVLVATVSSPRWATVLNGAAALVTEQGGIAGHLANVAREFEVPALFGVEGATERLPEGEWVTVDAEGLRVYKGRIESLLEDKAGPRNLMEGSPVFEALKGAAQHIIPLTLLNPDSPAFKAKHCKTFHDITRFCHEKSVREMFDFGKEHDFPERSSKQLFCQVPMQWWILNLDDGFKEEVTGKYVRLENIASIPMLALWDGITAIPWEGPPAMDGKGFMSVMFEATTNRALTPGGHAQYAARNYFMISKHFCSLSSRLGFHFSVVESLVSDRATENYISFQFKGGAADFDRRFKRVSMVGEILESCGFRVEMKEDTLFSRLEQRDMDYVRDRLRILGYLTIHTRQLDMIMLDNTKVHYYRSKLQTDIDRLLTS